VDVSAVADDVVVAAGRQDVGAEGRGLVRADEVEHLPGAGAVRDGVHLLDYVRLRRVHRVVGAEVLCEGEGVVLDVDGRDGGGGGREETLQPDVAEPADADHDGVVARGQLARGLLRRVVGGDARVGVWGDVDRLHAVGQRDQRPLGGEEVLGEPAVGREPRELEVRTVHVLAEPAVPAGPAGHHRVADDGVALLSHGDFVAGLGDDARVLVAERHREGLGDVVRPHALDHVVVRPAPAGALDLDDDVVRPFWLGPVDLVDGEGVLPVVGVLVESGGLHATVLHARRRKPRGPGAVGDPIPGRYRPNVTTCSGRSFTITRSVWMGFR